MQSFKTFDDGGATSVRPSRFLLGMLGMIGTICAIVIFAGLSAAQTWTSLGPRNEAGVINHIQLQEETNRLFASSPDGGLWVIDLNASTPSWVPISDKLDNIEIRAFSVARTSLDVIYAANRVSALYKSTDRGASWTKILTLPAPFVRINKLFVYNSFLLYMATTTGLFRSSDSGATWTTLLNGDVRDVAFEQSGLLNIYAGVRNVGVLKTTNGGTIWTNILVWPSTDQPHTDFSIVPPRVTPSQTIKISLGERRSNGTAETGTNRTVAVKFGRHIWVSRDGGANFDNRDSSLITGNDAGNYQRSEDFVDDEWCNAIAVDPWNSSRILVGQTSLFLTTNGGTSWIEFNATPDSANRFSHEDFQDFAFSRTVQNLIFAANDGGVERSTAASPTFNKFYTNLVTSQLFRAGAKGNTLVANSDHNGILGEASISDSDGSWSQAISSACGYGNNSMERSDVYGDPKRPNRYYFFFDAQQPVQLGRLNFPYPMGNNCVGNATRFAEFRPFLIYGFPEKPQQTVAVDSRANSELILVASDVGRNNCNNWLICPPGSGITFDLMLTRNGDSEPMGANGTYDSNGDFTPGIVTNLPTWEVTAQSVDDPFVSVAFVPRTSGKNAYAITRSGALYTASIPLPAPAVINWTRHNGFVPSGGEGVRHFVPSAVDENTVYAITRNSFAKTSNGGSNWTVQNHPIPSDAYYSMVLDNNFVGGTEIYVGTSDGIYKGVFAVLGGLTWIKYNGNLPNVKVTQLVRDSFYFYAVTFGRGLWRRSTVENIGVSELTPVDSKVVVNERINLILKWTHPERWRLLDKIDLRIIDDEGTAIWVRFDEASNTFRLFDPGSGIYSRPYQPGTAQQFNTNEATMYLAESMVQGSGPTGPDVTLTYRLSFTAAAVGRTFKVEGRATDDFGNEQGFEPIGLISVRPDQPGVIIR